MIERKHMNVERNSASHSQVDNLSESMIKIWRRIGQNCLNNVLLLIVTMISPTRWQWFYITCARQLEGSKIMAMFALLFKANIDEIWNLLKTNHISRI